MPRSQRDSSAQGTQVLRTLAFPPGVALSKSLWETEIKDTPQKAPWGTELLHVSVPSPACLISPVLPKGRGTSTVASRREGGTEKSEALGPPPPAELPTAGTAGERGGVRRENPSMGAPPLQPSCPGPQLRLLTPSPTLSADAFCSLPGLVGGELPDPDHRGVTTGDH